MYKDKVKQREANRRAQQRRREGMTSTGMTHTGMTEYRLPELPSDTVLKCNADIGWPDILAMPRERIDEVYRAWRVA